VLKRPAKTATSSNPRFPASPPALGKRFAFSAVPPSAHDGELSSDLDSREEAALTLTAPRTELRFEARTRRGDQ
jgi:hypothetical protein